MLFAQQPDIVIALVAFLFYIITVAAFIVVFLHYLGPKKNSAEVEVKEKVKEN